MPFWWLLEDLLMTFWGFAGFCWIAFSLKRKPIFSLLGGPRWALIRSLFQEWISGCVFMRFSLIFCAFGDHLGSLWPPFGLPFFGDLASSFMVGAKVASGVPKRRFVSGFGYHFKMILDPLLEDLGYKLTPSFLAMP